jgi:hypothetical protein
VFEAGSISDRSFFVSPYLLNEVNEMSNWFWFWIFLIFSFFKTMFSLFYHSKTCLRLHTNVVVYSSSSRFFFIFFSFNYIWFHEICFFMKFVFVLSAIMSALVTVTRPSHSFKYNNSNTPFKKQKKIFSSFWDLFFQKFAWVFFYFIF